MALLLWACGLAAASAAADTTVALSRGDRIVVEGFSGSVVLESWERDALEVREEDGDAALVVQRAGPVVQVVRNDRKGRRRSVDALLRVPAWAEVEIRGRSLDVTALGLRAPLRIRNVEGDVIVRDVRGAVEIRSVEGEIDVTGVVGAVTASSQSGDVRVADTEGEVDVHSGDGEVVLERLSAPSVRAETQDGDVFFSGALAPGGRYGFFVHDGDAVLALPAATSARVSVSTFDGEFQAEFPVLVERFRGGREFEFVLGEGAAELQVQVFDGEIRLLRERTR